MVLAETDSLAGPPGQGHPGQGQLPQVVVVDLDAPGGLAELSSWRHCGGDTFIVGYLATPDRGRWLDAERSGADLVVNRGSLTRRLRERLKTPVCAERRRLWVANASDAAGRLGLVASLDDTPLGPLAVYNLGWTRCAVADRCPHARARLSEGTIEEGVITCPAHGSQFDLRSGERLRGPADSPIRVFSIREDGGGLYVTWG